jgi:hypothetical protein
MRRLDYIKRNYSPEVYERVEDVVEKALGGSDVDEETHREWEKQLPSLAARLSRINKRHKKGAISLLDARAEQGLAEQEFLEQAAPDAPMIPPGSEFVTELSRGYYVVKAFTGAPRIFEDKLALYCSGSEESWLGKERTTNFFKDLVDRVAPFQQWLGEQMGNCLRFYSGTDALVSGCDYFRNMIENEGNLYAVIRSSGQPKIAIFTYLTQDQEVAHEYFGKANTPADRDLLDEFFEQQGILDGQFSFSQDVEGLLRESTQCLIAANEPSAVREFSMNPLIALQILLGVPGAADPIFDVLSDWAYYWPPNRSGDAFGWIAEVEGELFNPRIPIPCEWAALATIHGLLKASEGLRSIYEFCSEKYAMPRDAQPDRGPLDVRFVFGNEIEPAPRVGIGLETPMDDNSTLARMAIFENFCRERLGVYGISLTHGILGPGAGEYNQRSSALPTSQQCTPWGFDHPFTDWTPQLEYEYVETAYQILDGIREFSGIK